MFDEKEHMVSISSKIQWSSFSWTQWLSQNPVLLSLSSLLQPFSIADLFEKSSEEKRKVFVETLKLLSTLSQDQELLAAAAYSLLVSTSSNAILDLENAAVKSIVRDYTHLQDIALRAQRSTNFYKESTKKMLLATVDDPRLVVVMLAQVLALLRQRKTYSQEYAENLARLTLDLFAPIANRLGIGQLKWEMEDLAFQELYNEAYQKIRLDLSQTKQSREIYISDLQSTVRSLLEKESISSQITGRSKHFYSIWKKMNYKNKRLSEVFDLSAIRILVGNIQDCYRVLGMIHTQWKYIPKEFNDYIANPKVNGYQSLHTAVFGPNNQIVEVQIRTQSMHDHAEMGIAAHWMYKEHHKDQERFYQKKLQTLRHLLSNKESKENDLFESMKEEIFEDRIYVFTPKGDLHDLPKGATSLDFAYQIHTELGHHCCGARCDGKMLSLCEPLVNGMVVEIQTSQRIHPSRDWLNPHYGYLKTSRARQKVSHWFRSLDKDRQIHEGKILFEKLLKKSGHPLNAPIPWEKMLKTQHLKTRDEFYHSLFLGELKTNRVLDLIDPPKKMDFSGLVKESPTPSSKSHVVFSDLGASVLYELSSCCSPMSGDPIIGLINRGRAMTVHKMSCLTLRKIIHWEIRIVMAHWSHQDPLNHYSVQLMTSQRLQPHILQKVTENAMKNDIFCYISSGSEDQMAFTQMDLFTSSLLCRDRIKDLLALTFSQYGLAPESYQISVVQE